MPPILFAIFPILFWGSSFLATKILLKNNFSPMLISFVRFFLVFIALLFFKDKNNIQIDRKDWKYFIIMGFLGVTLFYYFENSGLKYTTIANTSLITATIPFFTLLYARIFLKKKLLWQNMAGIPISILGTFFLFYKSEEIHTHLKGDLYIFISVFLWIAYSFAYDKVSKKYSQFTILKILFGIGTLSILPFLYNDFFKYNRVIINTQTVFSFLYLSFICTLLAYYLWNSGIKKLGVKVTSNLILFIPIISISVGIIFWHEKFSLNLLLSSILIIIGSYLTSKRNYGHEF